MNISKTILFVNSRGRINIMNYSSKSCMIKCQHCSEEILHSAKVCRYCNRKTDDWTKGRIDKDGKNWLNKYQGKNLGRRKK